MSKIVLATDRVQTGVRMERRLVKVLKALAALQDMSLGDLLESLVRCAFAAKPGRPPLTPVTTAARKEERTREAGPEVGKGSQADWGMLNP